MIDREPERAASLSAAMSVLFPNATVNVGQDVEQAMHRVAGLIHATSTGMDTHLGMPLPADLLRPELWVSEIVYFPLETELLRQAHLRGCRTLSGGGMAVFQAVEAFRLFTGRNADAGACLLISRKQ